MSDLTSTIYFHMKFDFYSKHPKSFSCQLSITFIDIYLEFHGRQSSLRDNKWEMVLKN